MSFQEKYTILSAFLDLALFKCQIVLCVSTPDLGVWTRASPPPNPYHLGPNSPCAVYVEVSHKYHTQKAYLFVMIYTSGEMLVAVK